MSISLGKEQPCNKNYFQELVSTRCNVLENLINSAFIFFCNKNFFVSIGDMIFLASDSLKWPFDRHIYLDKI